MKPRVMLKLHVHIPLYTCIANCFTSLMYHVYPPGDVSGGATTLLEVHERLTREKLAGREGQNMDELDSSFRLLLLINSLDLSLLHTSVQQLGK